MGIISTHPESPPLLFGRESASICWLAIQDEETQARLFAGGVPVVRAAPGRDDAVTSWRERQYYHDGRSVRS